MSDNRKVKGKSEIDFEDPQFFVAQVLQKKMCYFLISQIGILLEIGR